MFKKIFIILVLTIILMFVAVFMAVNKQSSINLQETISVEDIQESQALMSNILKQIAQKKSHVSIHLFQSDLTALGHLASHIVPNTKVLANMSDIGIFTISSTQFKTDWVSGYINVQCLLIPEGDKISFSHCKIGQLPLPEFLVRWLMEEGLKLSMGNAPAIQLITTLDKAVLSDGKLSIDGINAQAIRSGMKSSIANVTEISNYFSANSQADMSLIQVYLDELSALKNSSASLSYYLHRAFSLAKSRSELSDPIAENTAAIWAIAILNSGVPLHRVIDLSKLNVSRKKIKSTLQDRRDLSQHFVTSMLLNQLGENDFALSVGQLKELMDSDGGTGFSFVDMAANKAGMMLARVATDSEHNAKQIQNALSNPTEESALMPETDDLTEGLSKVSFSEEFKNINSELYNEIETKINQRVRALVVYQGVELVN